jgi:ATP-binding cassette subfamily B protein
MLLITNLSFLGVAAYLRRSIEALKAGSSDVRREAALLAVFAILTAITRIWSRTWIFNAARAAEYDLRSDLFHHALRLSPAYYRDHPTGDVMSRLTNDVQVVRAMWGAGLVHLANSVTSFATVLTYMVLIDPIVAILAIIPYPLIFLVGQALSKRIFRTMREVQAELGGLSSRIQEDLGGIQVIKTYGLENLRRTGFVATSRRLFDKNMDAAGVRIQLGPLLNGLASTGVAIMILAGGAAVIHGDMNVGDYTALSALLGRLVWPTLTLGFMLALVQRGRASWLRLTQLQDTQPEIVDGRGDALPMRADPAQLSVRHLTIAIGDRRILHDVSFELAPNTVTAIVGRTGSGKTTIVEALCRLISVPSDTIFIDGHDITTLPLASLRAQIGYAPQEAFLFSTTIADNVAMGFGAGAAIPAARRAELERVGAAGAIANIAADPRVADAARSAGLERDLAAMPDHLATVVGERGITLSGGQRQRVALARALAASPRLLILDDSLSSVDAETERVILSHLRQVITGRTAVLISHRVAAIKDADQILVVDQGKIVERGTHAELIDLQGVYSDLYRTQINGGLALRDAG